MPSGRGRPGLDPVLGRRFTGPGLDKGPTAIEDGLYDIFSHFVRIRPAPAPALHGGLAMKIILFGASGMVGQAALRECLADPRVEQVLAVGRSPLTVRHPRLRECQVASFLDFTPVAAELAGYDACLFCLGVSSVGLDEPSYQRITYDYTLAAAQVLVRLNPGLRFLYVSGASTDSSASGRIMWARVKGRTENALLALPFRSAHMLRPGFIQPRHGIRSRTRVYRILYALLRPLVPLFRRLAPGMVLDSDQLGRAMVQVAAEGHPKAILEVADLQALGG